MLSLEINSTNRKNIETITLIYTTMKVQISIAITFLLFLSLACTKSSADLVVKNAQIWTGDSLGSEAQALAIKDDKIIFVGKNEEVEVLIGKNTQIIDAEGKLVTPGFIDSHIHFQEGSFALASVQLRDANTKEKFIRKIADFAKTQPKGAWITGGTWDHTLWGGELPKAAWIDSVTKDNPVAIMRYDGHMILANSLALRLSNINATAKEVEGGVIVRDKKGNPEGVLKDNAASLVFDKIPQASDEFVDKAYQMTTDLFLRNGVTSVHNMGNWDDLKAFRRLHEKNQLRLRIYANIPLKDWKKLQAEIKEKGTGDDLLKIGGLKGFMDGSLGTHTAAMKAPFSDTPNDKGFFLTPPDSMLVLVKNADKAGLNIMIHAIGDEAIHQLLNIYEKVEKENGQKDRRFRVEHTQHLAVEDIPRFARLKVIPSMQPYHAIDDGRFAEKYLGKERCKTTYAFKSLLDANARVAFGSDWFVAPPTPIEGIHAAVTRSTLDNKNPNGWFPEQKISVEQALRCYTSNAAYASFDEKKKGSLEVGKLADLVMIDKDIRKIAPQEIKNAQIVMTILGGKVVYKK